jgi:UDP-glucose 4-epimerase
MRLLVTGASGFIGRNLIRAVPGDWSVVATYRRSVDFPAFVERLGLANIQPICIDLTADGAGDWLKEVGPFDACVFLAANGDPARSTTEPVWDLQSNTISLIRLLEKATFERFVYFSSGAVYDGLAGAVSPIAAVAPKLPYAISKLASEHYLRHFQDVGRIKDLFIVRFFGAYGPFEPERKIYGRLVRRFAFEKNPRFTIRGDGRNLIDAMHIDDTIRAILSLLATPEDGAVVDCASGGAISVRTLVETAADVFGVRAELSYEGTVPEYIEFHSVDEAMRARYGFTPQIKLSAGLQRFAAFLSSVQNDETRRPCAPH